MAHYYRIWRTKSLARARESSRANRVLPLDFALREEAGELLIEVVSVSGTADEEVFARVQQECDRIAFLTGENLDPRFARKDNPDGSTTAQDSRGARTSGGSAIPADLDRQRWSMELPVQLRLWHLAGLPQLPIAVRIVLLFQIVEISFPNTKPSRPNHPTHYPEYTDSSVDPAHSTEAKLLRHLASHGKKRMSSKEIQLYCCRHKIPAVSNDPNDARLTQLFNRRLFVVKDEARGLIDQAITRRAVGTPTR